MQHAIAAEPVSADLNATIDAVDAIRWVGDGRVDALLLSGETVVHRLETDHATATRLAELLVQRGSVRLAKALHELEGRQKR